MSDNYEERDSESSYEEVDWTDYRSVEEEQDKDVSLEWRDYVALFIAALQTIFLPLIVLAIVFFIFGLLFSLIV
ncbi:MAG: hypothetical protein P1Q69_13425 [Candidatus Thorarchaeota archaeon]|nr:hypothetical protein [Candidatus Thorarchaeota archaeon]